ncbi:MAG: SPOR domain-containing protein [Desulfobacterales bacterium]|nr:SPOR domain-containing protein [Desulfobacterales bacterium]
MKDTAKDPSPGPEKKPGKTAFSRTALWVGGAVFISVWMFVLGVLVGRGSAPVQFDMKKLQKELATLKEKLIRQEQLKYNMHPDAVDEKPHLGFFEALKENQDILEKDLTADDETRQRPLPEKGAAGPAIKDETEQAKGEKDGGAKHFFIQIAATKDMKTAQDIVAGLKEKGYPASRVLGYIPGKGIWIRVRVGGFQHRAEAETVLGRLEKDKVKGVLMKQ